MLAALVSDLLSSASSLTIAVAMPGDPPRRLWSEPTRDANGLKTYPMRNVRITIGDDL